MPLATIQKRIETPAGGLPRGVVCHLTLVAAVDSDAFGYADDAGVDVGGARQAIPDATGLVTFTGVRPNSGAQGVTVPAGTVYQLVTRFPTAVVVEYLTVPDTAGPHWVQDILTTAPDDIDPAARGPAGADGADSTVPGPAGPTGPIDATYRQVQSALGGVPVATEAAWMTAASGGTTLDNNTRKRHRALTAFRSVRLVYANSYAMETTPIPNNIQVRAAVEVGATCYPAFFNGARTVTIEPGAVVVSDPISVPVAAAEYFWSRTWVGGITSGLKHPYDNVTTLVAGWGEGSDLTAAVAKPDLTLTPGVTGLSNTVGLFPIAVIGTPASTTAVPVVGLVGDSIGVGFGDTAVAAGRGFLRRALAETKAYAMVGMSGSSLLDGTVGYWAVPTSRRIRHSILAGCTHAICELGINDIYRGTPQTLAALQAGYAALWADLAAAGVKVYQTTITPVTTSTDNWATTANQTIKATGFSHATRTALNDWIRTTPAGLTGYFDTADAVETARNSGIWKVGHVYLTDALGLHASSVGHTAMAATIDPATFV